MQDIEAAQCPAGLAYLWTIYTRLNARRSSNGFGPNPISYSEMESYLRLHGKVLSREELDLLVAVDNAYLQHFHEKNSAT